MDIYNLETTDVKELQAYINERYPHCFIADCDLFDLAEGLYWYCNDYHTGQWSDEYSVLSALDYSPSPLADGVEEGSAAHAVYMQLAANFHLNKWAGAK
jgi:hypothetical protein